MSEEDKSVIEMNVVDLEVQLMERKNIQNLMAILILFFVQKKQEIAYCLSIKKKNFAKQT